MADISIDQAKAKIWIADVNNELEAVSIILTGVSNALSTPPEDDIMSAIEKVGRTMESAWTGLCNMFKTAQSKVEETVDKLFDTVEDVVEDAFSLRSKIGK